MTQELYQKAMLFAGEKHQNQKVPGTQSNYLLHISNVAMEILIAHANSNDFDLDFAVQTAILHDSLEDTDTSYDELKNLFGERIAIAVDALTKNSSLSSKEAKMNHSLDKIALLENEVGMVKIADRITNLQKPPQHWDKEKIKNYLEESKLIATRLSGKNEYLNNRLLSKIEEYYHYL